MEDLQELLASSLDHLERISNTCKNIITQHKPRKHILFSVALFFVLNHRVFPRRT